MWANLPVPIKIQVLSFGGNLQDVTCKCSDAVGQLAAASGQLASLGLRTDLQDCVLVSSLEFFPSERPGRPKGMTFAAKLACRADIWDILDRVSPGWCRGSRPLVHTSRWRSFFEPLPSTWGHLETCLAMLLEQRFLQLLAGTAATLQDSETHEPTDAGLSGASLAPGVKNRAGKKKQKIKKKGRWVAAKQLQTGTS